VSPALPVISGAQAVRALERAGFVQVGTRGSHVRLKHTDGRIAIVPLHRQLAAGTLRSILRQAHLSVGEFVDVLRG
jgi:predicted RNA binding protein YcfA (HicA-like mRNA interferase family)